MDGPKQRTQSRTVTSKLVKTLTTHFRESNTGGAPKTAQKFALHGACAVVIADVQDDKGQNVASSIGPDRSTYIHCDVTDEDQVKILIESTVKIYGLIDVMFSNAGIGSASKQIVMDFDLSNYDKLMAVNVRGIAACVKHTVKAMVKGGVRGSIVCKASVAASVGGSFFTDYTMSKHAVLGLMRSASLQLGAYGIRVNCVTPGPVVTPLLCSLFKVEAEDVAKMFKSHFGLYGMNRQPHGPTKQEITTADSIKFEFREANNKSTSDAKSRVSSPISNSPCVVPQLTLP